MTQQPPWYAEQERMKEQEQIAIEHARLKYAEYLDDEHTDD